ncbi:hypothetical protein ACJX0J_014778, partial [Zea mays]
MENVDDISIDTVVLHVIVHNIIEQINYQKLSRAGQLTTNMHLIGKFEILIWDIEAVKAYVGTAIKQEAIFSFVSMSYLVDMQVNVKYLGYYSSGSDHFFIASKFCDCIFPLYIRDPHVNVTIKLTGDLSIMRAVSRNKCLFSYNLKENPQQRKTTFLGSSWIKYQLVKFQGIEKGFEQGIEKGIEQGIEEGIVNVVDFYDELICYS